MKKNLLIVFAKNIVLGKVKTRLAETIGVNRAFEVYKHLVEITQEESLKVNSDLKIYFSDVVINEKWPNSPKFVQEEGNLGEKMESAFKDGFEDGYKNIVLIGSDCPDISSETIENAFQYLNFSDMVFGPAEDGGYYLIGMNRMFNYPFRNKPWSTEQLFELTVKECKDNNHKVTQLETLNDIDNVDDLRHSSIAHLFPY